MSHTFAEITAEPMKAAVSLREVAETARRDSMLIAMLVQSIGKAAGQLPDQLERDYLSEAAAALAAAAEKARDAADVLCSDVARHY